MSWPPKSGAIEETRLAVYWKMATKRAQKPTKAPVLRDASLVPSVIKQVCKQTFHLRKTFRSSSIIKCAVHVNPSHFKMKFYTVGAQQTHATHALICTFTSK